MRGRDKEAYKELGRVIGDKNKVERTQRGLDRLIQKTKKVEGCRKTLPAQDKRPPTKKRTICSSSCVSSGSCGCN